MVEFAPNGGFGAGLVMKNIYNQDPFKLLKEGKKLLKAMQGYRKKVQKAEKKGQDKPPVPAKIVLPPQNLPLPEGDQREMMGKQVRKRKGSSTASEQTHARKHASR